MNKTMVTHRGCKVCRNRPAKRIRVVQVEPDWARLAQVSEEQDMVDHGVEVS